MGYHIALLIMSALRYLAPQFLEEGRLCWLRSPLYIVNNGGKETYYFTDEEMDAARSTVKGVISRNKGLGSLSADRARVSMFSEEFQRMDVIIPDEESLYLLEQLMGEPVEPRRQFIFNEVDFREIHE
jgi:DNA gyrase/topoisomerase IV subunit B